MSCGTAGKKKHTYTGNQVGWLNFTGIFNYVAGGPPGSGLSAGVTVEQFIPTSANRRPWLRQDAKFDDKLLDAAYPTIDLQWFAEISFDADTIFRVSDRAFYVEDEEGTPKFYDARCEKAPSINQSVGEWLAPNYEIGDVSLTLNNRDGYYNPYLPYGAKFKSWTGAQLKIFIGFGSKRSNYQCFFEGSISIKQGLTATRDTVEIKAYDKLDDDEIPMPPRVYSSDEFPDIDKDQGGRPIPLIYGDWENDVEDAGNITATCINAADDDATEYTFKVSDTALQSLTEIYLHRGKRKEFEPNGPVPIDLSFVTIDLENGQFSIPKGYDVFDTEITYSDSETAGTGSTTDLITAKDDTTNFVKMRIQPGDRILKRESGQFSTIVSVANAQLTLSGGVTYAKDDEFVILTKKYAFISGDKLSLKCKGKRLNLMGQNRLSEISQTIKKPYGISIAFDGTYWIIDDATQKVYNIAFKTGIKETLNYSDIDPSITQLTGVYLSSDNKLWFTDATQSKIFRYDRDKETLGATYDTNEITGILAPLGNITGIAVQADNTFWIVDQTTGTFYRINPFASVQPFVVTTFNKSAFDSSATEILDVGYDDSNDQVTCVDRAQNKFYRLDETNGALISSFPLTDVAPNVTFVAGLAMAQDGTIFFVDAGTLTVYNYNDDPECSTNVAWICRDLLQQYRGHTYEEFDLSWNETARQLIDFKCRACFDAKTKLFTMINTLMKQFNLVFFLRFQKLALFWIDFSNFSAQGKIIKEKDIKMDSFKPGKEMDQYFNSAVAEYNYRPFTAKKKTSDTYVSPNAIAFVGREVSKKLDLSNVYKREDLDRLMPLFVKLAAPEPEFITMTVGFRLLRTQMQDFVRVWFDGEVNPKTGRKDSGRRFDHIPAMVRKITYDLDTMSVQYKLWSLGGTAFTGYPGDGVNPGGEFDKIVLSNLGRLGRISPTGEITASDTNSLTLADVAGQDAEARASVQTGKAWLAGYKVDLVDGATKEIIQTLTIDSVSAQVVTFVEDLAVSISATVKNAAGFINGGHYIQYSTYSNIVAAQKNNFASFGKPITNYPTSKSQEIAEQRSGVHGFDDGGIPYILYPTAFVGS